MMTNLQLAEAFAKEFHASGTQYPLDRNEWRAISMFAEWLDKRPAAEPETPLTYAGACNLLVNYAIALQDRQCCGDELQPQYLAALKACTDAMGVQPENREAGHE